MGREQRKESVAEARSETIVGAITRGSMVILIALGVMVGIIALLVLGSIKIATGDFPPGFIMLLSVGFVLSLFASWRFKRYQGQFVVLGISLLTIAGIIWAIFEDGLIGKAFMVLFVVTAGFMAVLGFYNVFIRKRQPNLPG